MHQNPRKVLIIKLGYIETLTNEPYKEGQVSLGDVLRTTAILHLYKGDNVTWLTDDKAVPLIVYNPYITRILTWSMSTILQLQRETYDVVINLEKNPGICALAQDIYAWRKFGFRFDREKGEAQGYNEAVEALYVATNHKAKRSNTRHWLDWLYEMVGQKWNGQGYIFAHPTEPYPQHAIVGLNNQTATKFLGKSWPAYNWTQLKNILIEEGITVAFQPLPSSLESYFSWINAQSLIVTNDSLGLHLAMAMDKRVLGLFGPTPSKEIHPYQKGIFVQGKRGEIESIKPEVVAKYIKELLNWGQG